MALSWLCYYSLLSLIAKDKVVCTRPFPPCEEVSWLVRLWQQVIGPPYEFLDPPLGTTATQYSRFWLSKDDVYVGCWEVLVQQLHVFTQFGEFGPVHERRRSFCAKITKLLENIFQWARHTGHRYKTLLAKQSVRSQLCVRVYGIGHTPRLIIIIMWPNTCNCLGSLGRP